MVIIDRSIRHGKTQMQRILREEIVVQTDLPTGTTFDFKVREVRVIPARDETERSVQTQMPTGNVFRSKTEAHTDSRLSHDRLA